MKRRISQVSCNHETFCAITLPVTCACGMPSAALPSNVDLQETPPRLLIWSQITSFCLFWWSEGGGEERRGGEGCMAIKGDTSSLTFPCVSLKVPTWFPSCTSILWGCTPYVEVGREVTRGRLTPEGKRGRESEWEVPESSSRFYSLSVSTASVPI